MVLVYRRTLDQFLIRYEKIMVRVCESNIIFPCISSSERPAYVHLPVKLSHLLLNHWAEFNQTLYITSSHCKGVREQHYFSMRSSFLPPCVRRPSIWPLRYLPLNHGAEFNQTCFMTSLHGKCVREHHYFSVRLTSAHLPVTLSPLKLLVGI